MNTDDRGPLDLTKQVDDLTQTVDGYKQLVETQQREIFELRKIASEVESHKNLSFVPISFDFSFLRNFIFHYTLRADFGSYRID